MANFFRKKKDIGNDWKSTGSFIRKPTKGWLHADLLLESSGVVYETKYVGAVKITDSMRNVPFGQRGTIVREAITICCKHSREYNFKAKKVSLTYGMIGDVDLRFGGTPTTTTISKSFVKAFALKTGESVAQHQIESISFASIGEDEYKNMIGYVSKDARLERACFVFECSGGLADDIILTVGQAFELKYKEYINKNPVIQPVVAKFTDPDSMHNDDDFNAMAKGHVYANHEVNEEKKQHQQIPSSSSSPLQDYDHLFNMGIKSRQTESDYSTLQHNNNSLASPTEFATGASYMGRDCNIATVYDNPIAGVNQNQQVKSSETANNGIYDNPNKIALTENKSQLDESKTNQKDPIYLVPRPVQPKMEKRPANPAPHNSGTILGDIYKQPWFHGPLSRDRAERIIHQDGEFLVRESGNSNGQFVLTGMRNGTHRHLLLVDPNGKVRTRDHSFETVPALIRHHMTHNIPISSGTSEVYLIHDVHDLSRDSTDSFVI